jgi:hypothetical protein
MVGVITIALYDFTADKLDTDVRFNNKERIVVVLIWPLALIMFVWTIIKIFFNGPN